MRRPDSRSSSTTCTPRSSTRPRAATWRWRPSSRRDHASRSRRRVRDGRSSHGAQSSSPASKINRRTWHCSRARRGARSSRPTCRSLASSRSGGCTSKATSREHPRLCWILPQATGGSFVEGADCCMVGAEVAARRDDGEAESFLLATAAIYRVAAGDEAAAIDRGSARARPRAGDRQPFVAGACRGRAVLRSTGHRCGDGARRGPRGLGDCRRG